MASKYRLKIDVTYTSTGNATTALTAINAALSAAGRAEVATRTGSQVYLMIHSLPSEAAAMSLANSLLSAWSTPARSYGKVSVVRTDATS